MSPGPAKILYVEDDPANRRLVRQVLTGAGYVLLEAADGLSGIQVAEQECPDLILMDIMLPDLDGYQVTTRLKSLPELAHTPIIALTAKVVDSARERALIAGCDGYIPKPIDVDLLPYQVSEFLAGKCEEIEGGAEERLALQREYTQALVVQLEEKVRALRKVNVELRHTDELKSKFISLASHELKTPLAVIHGYLTMLLDARDGPDPVADETLDCSLMGIARGVERLKAIVEDMLDVIRIESRTLRVHRGPAVVKEAVWAAVRKLESAFQERSLTIEVGPLDGLPTLQADAKRLKQAFSHLLSNAVKFTPDGGKINIFAQVTQGAQVNHPCCPISSAGDFVEIVFEDTGIGITPEEQERIFDLFYEVRDVRLHFTSKTDFRGGGLGLGLAIARGIVEAHGGCLWVESEGYDVERCSGSRFHVLLPIES